MKAKIYWGSLYFAYCCFSFLILKIVPNKNNTLILLKILKRVFHVMPCRGAKILLRVLSFLVFSKYIKIGRTR